MNTFEEKKEAEENRLRLEEEQRLAEIRAKKEKELRDIREKEALEAIFKQEQERFQEEEIDIIRLENEKLAALAILLEERQLEADWIQHLDCSVLPDPKIEKDMNTFLSLLAQDNLIKENEPSLKNLFHLLPNVKILSLELEKQMCIAEDNQKTKEYARLHSHLVKLNEIINEKWDVLTADILQHIDYFTREPNENFQLTESGSDFNVGIWGNVTKNPRFKVIEFTDQNMSASLPKPLALSSVGIRMLYQLDSTVNTIYQENLIEGKLHMSPVCGILLLDIVEFPELPKIVDNWNIRQILSPNGKLKKLAYPFKKVVAEEEATDEKEEEAIDSISWPTLVSYQIQENCFIDKNSAKVMYFKEETKSWEDDNISDVEIDVEKGLVKFRTTHFKPTAVVQHTYSEYPYRSWQMYPIGKDKAIISIQGKNNLLELEVYKGECKLLSPSNNYIKNNLQDKYMSPRLLLKKISMLGLNFTAPESLIGLELEEDFILKNPVGDEMCSLGISLCAQSFCFRQSPSNRKISSSKCTFQFKEFKEGDIASSTEENDLIWNSVLFDVKYKLNDELFKVGFVVPGTTVTNETKFDFETQQSSIIHSSVYHMIKPYAIDPVNISRLETSSALFTRTIYQILKATKLISW
ncbi:Protein casc1 [Clydaea vesicula]|uniref:Protein casc1 n=1 Tax=Clydaea vesicula TaxID=447962 RepID=A0AAD5U4X3_9FUNG|nr:Protein casc1 [Clydaea vesicula]